MSASNKAGQQPVAPAQLFRHSLREGRVHPLLHLVQRYRQGPPP